MRESKIERKLTELVEALGGECVKLSPDFYVGIMDRMVLLPGGRVIFVELKAPGKPLRKIQERVAARFIGMGMEVRELDSMAEVHEFINDVW